MLNRSPLTFTLPALLALTLAACGSKAKDGTCEDYEPMDFCDDEYVYVCETTDEGCRQCGCVPTEEADRSYLHN